MSRFLQIHPVNPQPRLITQVVEQLRSGAVLVYPTDSSYALGCQLGDKTAAERIRHIRQTDRHHNFTLVCRDLAEIATYAKVDNRRYRLLKAATPGPFTFRTFAAGLKTVRGEPVEPRLLPMNALRQAQGERMERKS